MNLISILILILGSGYLLYVVIESFLIRFYRRHIKCVIHVNGIRGKSSTVRLIDSGLREFNYRVMSKVTGTIPTIIDVNNNEIIVKRKGNANIREQIRILRKAYKDKIDYLILECMAVNPSLQKVCEENILRANITIITNVREDHINEMGDSLEELAIAMSFTTPTSGYLITSSNEYKDIFNDICKKKNSKLIISKPISKSNINCFEDNIGNALEAANCLNLDKTKYLTGMSKFKPDMGQLSVYKIADSIFINGLSINDKDSIKIVYEKLEKQYDLSNLTILLNNREDRPSRLLSLLSLFNEIKVNKVIVAGSNIAYTIHKLKKMNRKLEVVELKDIKELEKERIILGIGNIKNKGLEILEYYKKGERLL